MSLARLSTREALLPDAAHPHLPPPSLSSAPSSTLPPPLHAAAPAPASGAAMDSPFAGAAALPGTVSGATTVAGPEAAAAELSAAALARFEQVPRLRMLISAMWQHDAKRRPAAHVVLKQLQALLTQWEQQADKQQQQQQL